MNIDKEDTNYIYKNYIETQNLRDVIIRVINDLSSIRDKSDSDRSELKDLLKDLTIKIAMLIGGTLILTSSFIGWVLTKFLG